MSDGDTHGIFELLGRPGGITLGAQGFHHPTHPNGSGSTFTPYADITHLVATSRALWIANRRSSVPLRRSAFKRPEDLESLVAALYTRIASLPGGDAQLARMAQVDEYGGRAFSVWATWGLLSLCVLVFALQLLLGRNLHEVSFFSGTLVAHGDYWRLVTANLVHAHPSFPVHLLLNAVSALVLGMLLERGLGTARTLCVMGAAGIVSMLACGLAGYPVVVGASGVVAGMLGAVTWLEFFRAEELPAWRRVPRGPLVVLLILSLLLDAAIPILAGAAHLGGFLAGAAVVAWMSRRRTLSSPPSGTVRIAGLVVLMVTGTASLVAAVELWRFPDYVAHNLSRFAGFPEARPVELNNLAWMVAIDPEATDAQLWAALALSERAVAETQRSEPNILDTLAELHFQLGDPEAALRNIDEAIAIAPFERYYHEQRRRFTGERDADDLPEPGIPWEFWTPEKGSGVTV